MSVDSDCCSAVLSVDSDRPAPPPEAAAGAQAGADDGGAKAPSAKKPRVQKWVSLRLLPPPPPSSFFPRPLLLKSLGPFHERPALAALDLRSPPALAALHEHSCANASPASVACLPVPVPALSCLSMSLPARPPARPPACQLATIGCFQVSQSSCRLHVIYQRLCRYSG